MIYDLIYQGLSEEQCSIVRDQAVELHRRALYADQFKDERIMHDYVEKMREGDLISDKEVKKYIECLYGIANQGWEEAKGQYTFGSFLEDTGRMADELRKRKLQEEAEKTKQEARARQEVEQEAQRARQLEEAFEQKNLEKIAIRACCRKLAKFDDELQSAVGEESEDKIVEAAVSYARGSPEQVIDAIIEEIKINREKIIKEGRVSAEIIDTGVRGFLNHGTSLGDIDVTQSVSAGTSRDSGSNI